MHYDPTYAATIATVIPVIFVTFAIDLGMTKRPFDARVAALLATVVLLLLLTELLCLAALREHRELDSLDQLVVVCALLFSGALIFLRVASPLLGAISEHVGGRVITNLLFVAAIVLVVLAGLHIISDRLAADIFALTIIVVGWLGTSLVGGPLHQSLRRHDPDRTAIGEDQGASSPDREND